MSNSEWTQKNGTLSHKNAIKEFGLSENEIIQAMTSGKLQYRQNYAHGNPYYKFLRSEVKALAQELHGVNEVQTSLRGVILPPDFLTLFYLRGESPTSSWSNFPAGVTALS